MREEKEAGRKPSGLVLGLLLGLPTAVAMAALLATRPPPFVERDAGGAAVELQASCGSPAQACRKGSAVYLRLVSHGPTGLADVTLLEAAAPQRLAVAIPVSPTGPVVIPVKLVPDDNDVTRGFTLDTAFTPEGQAAPLHHLLTLDVQP